MPLQEPYRLVRKVMRKSQQDFEVLNTLRQEFQSKHRLLFSSSASVGIDVVPQHELAKADVDLSVLKYIRDYDEVKVTADRILGVGSILSIGEKLVKVPLGDIAIESYGVGRFVVGAVVQPESPLYEERDKIRSALQRQHRGRINWDQDDILLNAFEFAGSIATAEKVADVLASEIPNYVDVYALSPRRTKGVLFEAEPAM